HHPHWYMGKDTTSGKYGVYDSQNKRWQVPPKYDYLQRQVTQNIAVYSTVKSPQTGDSFGLIDLTTNREITPPIYKRISMNGRVIRMVNGQFRAFYINFKTGKEYREKRKQ